MVKKVVYAVFCLLSIVLIVLSIFHQISWWITVPVIAVPLLIWMSWENFMTFLKCTVTKQGDKIAEVRFVSMDDKVFFLVPALISLCTWITIRQFDPTATGCVTIWATIVMLFGIILGDAIVKDDIDPLKFLRKVGLAIVIVLCAYAIQAYTQTEIFQWIFQKISTRDVRATSDVHLLLCFYYTLVGGKSFLLGILNNRMILNTVGSPSLTKILFLRGKKSDQILFSQITIEDADIFEALFGAFLRITITEKETKEKKTYRVFLGAIHKNEIEKAADQPNIT